MQFSYNSLPVYIAIGERAPELMDTWSLSFVPSSVLDGRSAGQDLDQVPHLKHRERELLAVGRWTTFSTTTLS
jgi:hypothetical protein